ncbi:transposase [Parvularcula maris]|uniref:Transposase n=1 Tax=Parvularcula maris TaxID=2965077 RepID=A0A9X2L9V1_9PROT|nr:transposase [Parvularcula maris]MCQ8185779.1 transposase [Parvularcula maris]
MRSSNVRTFCVPPQASDRSPPRSFSPTCPNWAPPAAARSPASQVPTAVAFFAYNRSPGPIVLPFGRPATKPHPCYSGQRRGRRRVWGGRATVRKALYQAAFSASRCDPELKAFRMRLEEQGKPFKTTIIATARRLLERLKAIIRDNRNYAL